MLCYVVQRGDVDEVAPADAVDPAYGDGLRRAVSDGVEVLAFGARVGPRRIVLERQLAVVLGMPPGRRRAPIPSR